MPIDYSKWDKIELSDDSDIEVHPNVDKNSFIKWKQRDIHEKRQQRNIEIKSILIQLTMYAKLNERVDFLLATLSPPELLDDAKVMKVLNDKFDKSEKFDYEKLIKEKGDSLRKGLKDLLFDAEEIQNTPPYNEMIEDLFVQVKEDHPEAATDAARLAGYIKEHRAKIDDVLLKLTIKLDDLLYQKSLLISSDDYHTGFDRSFLNKTKDEEPEERKEAKAAPAKKTETSIETINSPKAAQFEDPADQDLFDQLEVKPATAEFAKIKYTDLQKSAEFLVKHPSICTENQKDSLIMTAFDYQLEGDEASARQVIYQSLLLQYIAQLAGPKASNDQKIRAIKLFFSKLKDSSIPASHAFNQDVENTVNHIRNRCEILKQERQESAGDEGEALIQLKSLDDSTTLEVNYPEEGTKEHEIFVQKLSPEMQAAVLSGSLDEVNKVFAEMKVEDAEAVLEIFQECNVIGISGVLENEEEFQKLKLEAAKVEEEESNRVDIATPDTVD
ncbi:hypothetical protein PUMCH_004229 [Australozyma saopauloensis]|uniref:Hsp90 chaperone protein kinase-targeting subunit n=1 Tax=Australozyma saopauloensis TaxID=291208 RepID=A0AAX4HGT6_9ASCO|nr:hypothetical protein PUMCH_004229 [[Candida] saopauloensis]